MFVMCTTEVLFFDSLLKALGNDVTEVSRWKEGRNEINFTNNTCQELPRYAQCVFMGAIVDQVSQLMASNFLAFFGRWRWPWREP